MNDDLVQNMDFLDEQAIHIQSEEMQYTAESNARQKCITQNDSAYRSISASISLSRLASPYPDQPQPRRGRGGRRCPRGLLLAGIVVIVSWGCSTENCAFLVEV